MNEFGVDETCVDEVALAITEACANVIEHSKSGPDMFEIYLQLDEDLCTIRVVDRGNGFDFESLDGTPPSSEELRGRGVPLMKALVDNVHFDSRPDTGTVVLLEKKLTYDASRTLP